MMRQAAGITGRLAGSLAVLGLFVFVAFQGQPGADAADIVLTAAEAPQPLAGSSEPAVPADPVVEGFEWSLDEAGWSQAHIPVGFSSTTVMGSDGYLWSVSAEGPSDHLRGFADGD